MSDAYLIIEARDFTARVKTYFGDEVAYAEFQAALVEQPDQGAVIAGASPLRKLRWRSHQRGKGKRGGLRVIYIHILELQVLFMLDVYGKDEADDLTPTEKTELRDLARQLVLELKERKKRGNL